MEPEVSFLSCWDPRANEVLFVQSLGTWCLLLCKPHALGRASASRSYPCLFCWAKQGGVAVFLQQNSMALLFAMRLGRNPRWS